MFEDMLEEATHKEKVLLIMYTAAWAEPCQKMEPAWQKLASEHALLFSFQSPSCSVVEDRNDVPGELAMCGIFVCVDVDENQVSDGISYLSLTVWRQP